jgi:protein-disulfide isomerase
MEASDEEGVSMAKARTKGKAKRRKVPAAGRPAASSGGRAGAAPPPRSTSTSTGQAPSAKAWIALAVGLAVALAVVLIVASRLGSDDNPEAVTPAGEIAAAGEVDALLRGIPQEGVALGDPDAPVTLVEFADLQCPFCAQFSREGFPALVQEYVRDGDLRIVFRPLTFIGDDSEKAARAALAAGEQDRLWHVVDLLYISQGGENSGWVTDDLLAALGPSVPGLDGERMLDDMDSAAVDDALADASADAQEEGVDRTPFFLLGATDGEAAPFQPQSYDLDGFRAAIDRLLKR